ncbi:MAG: hypothetical protein IJT49_10255 [Clostridia bacterium]|nr:hypothetical protein [Clostridia bacterium]
MKKILAVAIVALMMLTAAVPAFAGQNDDVFKTAVIDVLVDLDSFDEQNGFQMRGFAVSPDGKYVYGGFLQNYRHVSKIDAATGEHLGEYAPEIENDEYDGVVANNNYPKGLAVDCRGYLFVGITHDVPNTSYISIAVVDTSVDEEGYMKEITHITEDMDTTRVGINGIAAQKIGDKILLYVVTCYNKDTIRCYDVTDITDIKLYSGFGNGGVVDYNELTGSQSDPGYITVDVDGYIYMCYKQDSSAHSKGSHVMKIDTDGKSMVDQVEVREAYGICTAGDYLFVSTYDGPQSKIVVLNKSDLSSVAEMAYADQFSDLSGCGYGGDRLFIGDHGEGTAGSPGTVLQTTPLNITRDPRETETVAQQVIETTEAATEQAGPDENADSFTIVDLTNPETVSKIGNGNNVELTYDEVEGCLKITVTGEDPYFTLPMKKEAYFDGDKFNTVVLTYKTAVEYATGEIFFTTKESRDLGSNHITYEMEEAAEFTELEIDMRDDDNGNWHGQVRSIRLDPSTDGSEDQVFFLKSVAVKVGEEIIETEPDTTEAATETEPAVTETETEKADDTTEKTEDTDKTPAETKPTDDGKKSSFNPLFVIIPVCAVVVIVVVVIIIVKSKKK